MEASCGPAGSGKLPSFALAKRTRWAPAVAGAATTHRATEMAIGMAADELYAALPKETQAVALGNVPTVIVALAEGRDASCAVRARPAAGVARRRSGEAAEADDGYARCAVPCATSVAERHKQVITALETTRLDLLRLHAGAIKVDGFTTHFDAGGRGVEPRYVDSSMPVAKLERFLRLSVRQRVETPA
jgi:hypothetical protein